MKDHDVMKDSPLVVEYLPQPGVRTRGRVLGMTSAPIFAHANTSEILLLVEPIPASGVTERLPLQSWRARDCKRVEETP